MLLPYFCKSDADIANKEKVHSLIHAYLDLWLKIWHEEDKVSEATAKQIEYRRMWVIKMLLEREPERQMMEKIFGKELTARLGEAMV